MRYGSPLAAGFGNPENKVAWMDVVQPDGSANLQLSFRPVTGLGNAWFGIYRNSRFVGNVYAAEGQDAGPFEIQVGRGETDNFFAIIRLGELSDPGYHIERVARTFELNNSPVATVTWVWQPECLGAAGEAGQTYNWSFTKIGYSATQPLGNQQDNWSSLRLDMLVDATNLTLNLYRQNTLVAQGVIALAMLPGNVTLAELDDSGVAGQCAVYASPVETLGATVLFRWPASMTINRATGPLGPWAAVGSLDFNYADIGSWTESSPLDSSTYYYALQPVSDTGENGEWVSIIDPVTIYGPPEPPTDLHYISGNAGATIIGWTPSVTEGATYNVYTAADGEAFDLNNPDQSLPAGSNHATLGPFSGVSGVRCILVRAVSA